MDLVSRIEDDAQHSKDCIFAYIQELWTQVGEPYGEIEAEKTADILRKLQSEVCSFRAHRKIIDRRKMEKIKQL